jgi:catechol 2,3-dioxygenase
MSPPVAIAHVNLRVADLDRALEFYVGVLGYRVNGRLGDELAFLAAREDECDVALSTTRSRGGAPPPRGATGLGHVALRYPTQAALAAAVRKLQRHGVAIDDARDHGVTQGVHCSDPDGNGLELCWERPREQWPRTPSGELALVNEPLALDELLSCA